MFKLAILFGLISSVFSTSIPTINSTALVESNFFNRSTFIPQNNEIVLNNTYVSPFENIPKTKTNLRKNKLNTVASFTYLSCGDSSDIAQNVKINVDPALPQTDYVLFLDADLSKDVTGGTSKYDISLNGIPFSPTINDLCTEIANSNITCPLTQGALESQSKGTIPTGVSGKIVIKNQWYNTENERILCMSFTIKTT